jgi:hypothetical protein
VCKQFPQHRHVLSAAAPTGAYEMSAGLARLDLKAGGAVGANEDPELVSLRAGIHFGVGMLHAVMSMVRSSHTLPFESSTAF